MEYMREFLDSSTIHGLYYIANTKKFVRFLWTLIVIAGFSGATYLIYESFQTWKESPVSTTTQTLPIQKITFPKITVCPPKNTFTDLNFDIMMNANVTLTQNTRDKLSNLAVRKLNDWLFSQVMKNLSMVEDNDRYYNWYHGYAAIKLPNNDNEDDYDVNYFMDTCATSGTVSTRGYGKKLNATEFDTNVWFKFNLTQNPSMKDNIKNVTFHAKIQRVKSIDVPEIRESLYVNEEQMYGVPIELRDNPPQKRIIELREAFKKIAYLKNQNFYLPRWT